METTRNALLVIFIAGSILSVAGVALWFGERLAEWRSVRKNAKPAPGAWMEQFKRR